MYVYMNTGTLYNNLENYSSINENLKGLKTSSGDTLKVVKHDLKTQSNLPANSSSTQPLVSSRLWCEISLSGIL